MSPLPYLPHHPAEVVFAGGRTLKEHAEQRPVSVLGFEVREVHDHGVNRHDIQGNAIGILGQKWLQVQHSFLLASQLRGWIAQERAPATHDEGVGCCVPNNSTTECSES